MYPTVVTLQEELPTVYTQQEVLPTVYTQQEGSGRVIASWCQ